MCGTTQQSMPVASPADEIADPATALAAVRAGLAYLARADAAAMPGSEQAELLRGLAAAESAHLAATASVLAAFTNSGACTDDGQMTARAWLRWQTRITGTAASACTAWMRRLVAHPAVAAALANAAISPSFARCICDWSDQLPGETTGDADRILLAAATHGAELADLAGLAEEMRRRCAPPSTDSDDDGFAQRGLRLTRHFEQHAHLDADLTPPAASALQAVLDVFNTKAGPEDDRTAAQRDHDALEEACRQLIATGLPDRAGQPTQIQLHMTLSQLLGQPEASQALAAWIQANGTPAPPGADCDADIATIVTGTLDPGLLDQLAAAILRHQPAGDSSSASDSSASDSSASQGQPCGTAEMARRSARYLAISQATRLLSGPEGLAAWLRTSQLTSPVNSISLPLDTGKPTETIPPHLRRAIAWRDRHCRFPGCDRPPSRCQVHHLIPRSQGGPTSLGNCCELCVFHHLIAIHRWGWRLVLNPDGTTTATSPDGTRTLHSHAPPNAA